MNNFRLKGIVFPGRVHHQKYGLINLSDLSDTLAEEIWKDGCPYLEPTPEGRKEMFPDEKEISIEPLPAKRVKTLKTNK